MRRVGPTKAFPSSPHMVLQLRTTDLDRNGRLLRGSPSQGFAGDVTVYRRRSLSRPLLGHLSFSCGGKTMPHSRGLMSTH